VTAGQKNDKISARLAKFGPGSVRGEETDPQAWSDRPVGFPFPKTKSAARSIASPKDSSVKRGLYLLAMYSGLRAAFNRIRSGFLRQPRSRLLDAQVLMLPTGQQTKLRVHARCVAKFRGTERIAGMISVVWSEPGIHPSVYWLWQLTSHFGCGHVELAFFEERGVVHFYAVRNILRSNLERIGFQQLSRRLPGTTENSEIMVIKTVCQTLQDRGLDVVFLPPHDCVSLAVTESLLDPKQNGRCFSALLRKYRRIFKRVSLGRQA
jgi:hypothetical protein